MMKSYLFAAVSAAVLQLAGTAAQATDVPTPAKPLYGAWGVDLTAMDKSVKPGDDFFRYVEGSWLAKAVVPADKTSTGVGYDVFDRVEAQLKDLVDTSSRAASAGAAQTPAAARVGALYNAFMDEARVDKLDDAPLRPRLAAIGAVADKAAFTRLMGQTNGNFGMSLISVGPSPDPARPEINTLYVGQAGLGLPDRDYYLTDGFKPQRDAYLAYITRTLTLTGVADPARTAAEVLAVETRIAEVSWAAADRRDLTKVINPMSLAELSTYAPGLDWTAYLEASGIKGQVALVVGEKSAVQKIAALYAATPLATLKAWESFHVAHDVAPYLSKRFVDNRFEFAKSLTGVTEQRPRWKRGVALIDQTLGEDLGREYVARWFPPASKAKMVDLVANLKLSMANRIQVAAWMAPSTKAEALKKLSGMDVQIGYPDKWRDYSKLEIRSDDLVGDVARSAAFEWAYQLEDLNMAVDHKKWGMTPQTVNAYNGGFENKIVFPAGILQPPYFDPAADDAVNYGSVGAIIGHEITHGFDDDGRRIDSTGKLRDWWTAADAKQFDAQAEALAKQYDTYEPVKGMHINGKLTNGENIADLGGLLMALDAYHASLKGKPAPVIDGLTGDQRLFLSYGQSWRAKERDDALKAQMSSDPHSPDGFRVLGATRNVDAWYTAFGITSGTYYLAPKDRVRIW